MIKVIHFPTSVGGNAWGLSRAERELGLVSDVLVLHDNWLTYPADRVLLKSSPTSKREILQTLPIKLKEILHLLKTYDVFHLNFGSSLFDHPNWGLHLADLPLYRRKGKVFVTYNGCDARQKYPTMQRVAVAACHQANCYAGICNSGKRDQERRIKIEKVAQYAHGIFALNPDLLYFLPEWAVFLPYSIARWHEIVTEPYHPVDKCLHIVHAPTNRVVKGSDDILAAIEKLAETYPNRVKLTLVENIPHHQALAIYRQADLIIDQVLIGWYGGFAVEALKMGKPVMVFIREEDLKFIPEKMAQQCLEAFITTHRDTLYHDLCKLMEMPSKLKDYREAGLDYVHTWHAPTYVAGLTKAAYENA